MHKIKTHDFIHHTANIDDYAPDVNPDTSEARIHYDLNNGCSFNLGSSMIMMMMK